MICLKAMATLPQDRYASSMELAQAVERWLADEPIIALRDIVTELERLAREEQGTTIAREQLARSRANLAIVLTSMRRNTESVSVFEQSVKDYESLINSESDSRRFHAESATVRIHYSRTLVELGREADAAEQQNKAMTGFNQSILGSNHEYRSNMESIFLTMMPGAAAILAESKDAVETPIRELLADTNVGGFDAGEIETAVSTANVNAEAISETFNESEGNVRELDNANDSIDMATFIAPENDRPLSKSPAVTSHERFRVLQKIASGGTAIIYKAVDQDLSREVAIKVPAASFESAHNLEYFKQEAKLLASLEHANILPIFEFGYRSSDRTPFMIVPLVKGEDLHQAIVRLHDTTEPGIVDRSTRFESQAFRKQLRSLLSKFTLICDAIEYAHSRGIIHRDPKPANILLGENGEVFLCDWGLSAYANSTEMLRSIAGTPAYMSPEAARGMNVGFHSDIYVLGATLFHLLTGQTPYQRGSGIDILKAIVESPTPEVNAIAPAIPSALNAICSTAMSKQISGRYQSARELGHDLKVWLSGDSSEDSKPGGGT